MKKTFYSEIVYVLGILFLALGTAFMERADFGMSMVVAPAYVIYRKVSAFLPWFTFGTAEYCLQFVLIAALSLVLRKFKKGYLFSFITAVVYGLILDLCIALLGLIPGFGIADRCLFFVLGILSCSMGVAFCFHTYFAPEAYELVVKELSLKTGTDIGKVKTVYDLVSLTVSVILSFCFFGFLHFEGVKLGTLITALINGWIIGRISASLDRTFEFKDLLPIRSFFEE